MKLSSFIKEHKEEIAKEWVNYARENIDVTAKMNLEAVRDHIIDILDHIADDMNTEQTSNQQKDKSRGKKPPERMEEMAAKEHGIQRGKAGFDIVQLSSEFRALRASVLHLWKKHMKTGVDKDNFEEMIRFNEAIDEVWMHSMIRFDTHVDESRQWLMGVLGHDLRSPLASISGAQQFLSESPSLSDGERKLVMRARSSVNRMEQLINNLLELTKSRLGGGMTISKAETDLTLQSQKIIHEFIDACPDISLRLQSPGPVQGQWDRLRIDQVLTNMIGNAIRHGKPGRPVTVHVSAKDGNAYVSVHNEGNAIPKSMRDRILSGSYTTPNSSLQKQGSYGLGFFIIKEVINGHSGSIEIESTEEKGTTFTVILPQYLES